MGAAHGAPARTDANIGAVRDPGGGLCYRKPSVTQRRTSAAAVGCNHCNQGANRLNFPVWSHHYRSTPTRGVQLFVCSPQA